MKFGAIVTLLLASVALSAGDLSSGQGSDYVKVLKTRQKDFEVVWQTIAESYFDPAFGGVDWKRVRQQYEPKLPSVKSDEEFYGLLNNMLSELGRSHLSVIPGEAFKDDAKGIANGECGMDALFIDDQALITRVMAGSAADRAGIRQGFVIKEVDGMPVSRIAEPYQKRMLSLPLKRAGITQAIMRRLNGPIATPVRISYVDQNDESREANIVREARRGNMVKVGGGLPALYVDFESTRLAGGIGYIRFSFFTSSIVREVRNAIKSMSDAPGIIIDLRGNLGGFGEAESDIAGLLVNRETTLSICRRRNKTEKYEAHPKKDAYPGPVTLLVNVLSLSGAEDMAAALQESGRVMVVGEPSPGADMEGNVKELPSGARLIYPMGECKTANGTVIEGRGVIPDVEVKLNRTLLLKKGDPQLEEAIKIIKSKVEKAKTASN